jgi:uncharacterized protein YebE (UPF0316 family)
VDPFAAAPIWLLCALVFTLRVLDVTLGTLRTVSIVKGHMVPAVVLGFFELLIWVAVISQVISRLHESWWLGLAYAGGFAAGNGLGVMVEKSMARGSSAVRLYSKSNGRAIAETLREHGMRVLTFGGSDGEGDLTLVHVLAPRRQVRDIVRAAKGVDPDIVFVAEPAHGGSRDVQLRLRPVPNPTGWRAVVKKK